MKIAIVVTKFPEISETFVLNHITGLLDLEHDVDVYAFKQSDEPYHKDVYQYKLLEKLYAYKIPKNKLERACQTLKLIFTHPLISFKCLGNNSYKVYERVNNLIKTIPFLSKKYDVVHCHFGTTAKEFIFLKEIYPDFKFYVTFHGYDIRLGLEKDKSYYRRLFSMVTGIISICDYNKKQLLLLGCPEEKIVNHANGVYVRDYTVQERRNSGEEINITSIGRLVDEKNYYYAVDIIEALIKRGYRKIKYSIVGDGYLKEELSNYIKERDLNDYITFMGSLPHNEVKAQLQKTDVFLMTSKQEAFPIVILEAQAMQVPVVTTEVGGIADAIINNKTGFLIPLNDVDKASEEIEGILQSSSKILEMGKVGRKFIEEKFDLEKLNNELVELYSS